ncbi:MAG: alpha/beta hydrolase [Deltaproteobacteria bacterium]|nr:alpha/beta hydrolase [Deltaproteobacteria bacterium]
MFEEGRLHGEFLDLGRRSARGLSGRRRVRVFVPDVKPPYSVIYCWDGQNLFDDEGSHAGGWHLHHVLSQRVATRKPTPLLVAIDHGRQDRIDEFAPWPHLEHGNGRADAMLELLLDRVMPAVERRFQTVGRPGTIVCGSSMGGLLSLYAWLRFPGVFGRALVMSPSLWFNRRALLDLIGHSTPLRDARLYLDMGSKEGGVRATRLVREVAEAVVRRGLDHYRVMVRVDPMGEHRESDWRNRFPLALDFLLEE